ncbi:uncharacterized protein LOC115229178 [Octopus sinensis]|uniref:Uncharacterized protein LOC115229178 n=1 Tax=Octopus sinensis TaxID=2607531 RepID=A0A6P7TT43_9MOLL|nr:uncharacterized protein LOC115229178 [Octopus sinensis]
MVQFYVIPSIFNPRKTGLGKVDILLPPFERIRSKSNGNHSAPVLAWLQGGPSGSSLYSLFEEHGPFTIDKYLKVIQRNVTWTRHCSVIYIDNPMTPINDLKLKYFDQVINGDLTPYLTRFFNLTGRRNYFNYMANKVEKLKEYFKGSQIFLVIDETQHSLKKYVNIIAGKIDNPTNIYLIDCICVEIADASSVCQTIDDCLRNYQIERKNFVLLLTDAAPYMMSAATSIRIFYPNMIHLTCFAHLLHNCALKVRSHYQDIDFLISSMKIVTLKNKSRQKLFSEFGLPSDVVVTRWGSWLNAATYYSKHLNKISSLSNNGKIVLNAKKAIDSDSLERNLANISFYNCLSEGIKKCEDTFYTVKDAIQYTLKPLESAKFGTWEITADSRVWRIRETNLNIFIC